MQQDKYLRDGYSIYTGVNRVLSKGQLQSLVKTSKEIWVPLKTTAKFPVISTGAGFHRGAWERMFRVSSNLNHSWFQDSQILAIQQTSSEAHPYNPWLIICRTGPICFGNFFLDGEERSGSTVARREFKVEMGLMVFPWWWTHRGFYLVLCYPFSWLSWQRQNFPCSFVTFFQ